MARRRTIEPDPPPDKAAARKASRTATEAMAARRQDMFGKAPGRAQMAMTTPTRNASVSSSALRQVTDDSVVTKRSRRNRAQTDRKWQSEAFDYIEKVGELGALVTLQSNIVSLCGFPVRIWDDDEADWISNDPDYDDTAADTAAESAEDSAPSGQAPSRRKPTGNYDDRPANVMRSFVGPDGGQTELVRRAAYNLFAAGDSTLLGTPHPKNKGILWEFLSVEELYPNASGEFVRKRGGAGSTEEPLPEDNFTARLFRSSARFSDLADCEVKRVLPICVAAGELVYGPDGPRPVESVAVGDRVWAFDDGKLVERVVWNRSANGVKDVVMIRSTRRSIRVTPDHRMLVVRHDRGGRTMVDDRQGLAAAIRRERLAAGIRNKDLASAIGMSRTNICLWESGKYAPMPKHIAAIDAVLGTDLHGEFYRPRFTTEWVEARDLHRGDRLVSMVNADQSDRPLVRLADGTWLDEDVAWLLGCWVGDTCTGKYRIQSSTFDPVVGARQEAIVRDRWGLNVHGDMDKQIEWYSTALVELLSTLGIAPGTHAPRKVVPAQIFASPPKIQRAFLEGLWESDGCRSDRSEIVSFCSTSHTLAVQARALCIANGVAVANVTRRAGGTQTFPGGYTSATQPSYAFGVYRDHKVEAAFSSGREVECLGPNWGTESVVSVSADGQAEVFDLTVPGPSNFVCEGLVAHNCREIVTLTMMVDAVATSRLSANMLFIPDELSFAGSDPSDGADPDDPEADDVDDVDRFVDELFDHMTAPVKDPGSAARLVPLVIRGKGEFGQYIQVIDLSRQLDLWAQELRAEALGRLAQGLDAPPEAITGKSSLSHWSAANVDSEFIVKHIQPVGVLIADFLTWAYLRPMLEAYEDMSEEEALKFKVEFDPSPVIARADEAKSARDLSDWLSDDAILMANGFTKADMATSEEMRVRRLWTLISTQPAQFAKLLTLLPGFEKVDPETIGTPPPPVAGPDPNISASDPNDPSKPTEIVTGQPAPDDGKTSKTGDQVPKTKPPIAGSPDTGMSLLVERLTTAADAAVSRALERAGSRIVSLSQSQSPELRERLRSTRKDRMMSLVTQADMRQFSMTPDKLLKGAWDELAVQTRSWVRTQLEAEGVDQLDADDRGALAAHHLCTRLHDETSRKLLTQWKTGGNGLRIPTSLITEVLEQAAYAGVR